MYLVNITCEQAHLFREFACDNHRAPFLSPACFTHRLENSSFAAFAAKIVAHKFPKQVRQFSQAMANMQITWHVKTKLKR